MSPQAVSNKVRNDRQKAAVRLQPAFPAAVEEDSDLIDELPHLECARTSIPDPLSRNMQIARGGADLSTYRTSFRRELFFLVSR